MEEAARERLQAHFTIDRMVERTERLYRDCRADADGA
jgi:hypothetical protein